jgi:hypothetical protein
MRQTNVDGGSTVDVLAPRMSGFEIDKSAIVTPEDSVNS